MTFLEAEHKVKEHSGLIGEKILHKGNEYKILKLLIIPKDKGELKAFHQQYVYSGWNEQSVYYYLVNSRDLVVCIQLDNTHVPNHTNDNTLILLDLLFS